MVDAGDSRGVVMSRRRGTATIQLAMGLKRFGTRRRLLIAAMVLVPIFAIIAFTPAQAQLNENCVISILNRTAQVQPDGSWRIANVPGSFGSLRARATCVENGVTLTGESSLIASILGAAIVSCDFTSVGAEKVLLSAEESEKSGAMIRKESIELSLLQFLEKLGDSYDVFFTVEEAWQTGESTNQLSSHPVHVSPERTNLQQELEELQEMVANFYYWVNESNPQIVHVIDERLKEVWSYGMDETIKAIEFNGNVVELIQDINKKGIGISFKNQFLISDLKRMDFTVPIRLTQTPTICRVRRWKNSKKSGLDGIVEFE